MRFRLVRTLDGDVCRWIIVNLDLMFVGFVTDSVCRWDCWRPLSVEGGPEPADPTMEPSSWLRILPMARPHCAAPGRRMRRSVASPLWPVPRSLTLSATATLRGSASLDGALWSVSAWPAPRYQQLQADRLVRGTLFHRRSAGVAASTSPVLTLLHGRGLGWPSRPSR